MTNDNLRLTFITILSYLFILLRHAAHHINNAINRASKVVCNRPKAKRGKYGNGYKRFGNRTRVGWFDRSAKRNSPSGS